MQPTCQSRRPCGIASPCVGGLSRARTRQLTAAIATVALTLGAATSALAQDKQRTLSVSGALTGSATLTTDYRFRGVSPRDDGRNCARSPPLGEAHKEGRTTRPHPL